MAEKDAFSSPPNHNSHSEGRERSQSLMGSFSSPNLNYTRSDSRKQNISMAGSFCLLVNNISGPAMLHLPGLIHDAGWMVTFLLIFMLFVSSSILGNFFAEAMSRIPGNKHFGKKYEFSDGFLYFLGENWFFISQLFYYLSLLMQNIAAIVTTSQALDSFLSDFVIGESYALLLYPKVEFISWSSSDCFANQALAPDPDAETSPVCIPFDNAPGGDYSYLISAGYLLTTIMILPLGLFGLEETITAQLISFASLVIFCTVFLFAFYDKGLDSAPVPMFGSEYKALVGVLLYNYAFCVTIPSWLNEKRPSVKAHKVIWSSCFFSSVMYMLFGIMGAMAFGHSTDDILVALSSNSVGPITRVSSCLFGVLIIGLGVPVFCVLMHNNLVAGGLFSHGTSLFLGSILPFVISWAVYQGQAVVNILSWAGLVCNGLVAFVGPALLSWAASSTVEAKRPAWIKTMLTPDIRQDSSITPDLLSSSGDDDYKAKKVIKYRSMSGGCSVNEKHAVDCKGVYQSVPVTQHQQGNHHHHDHDDNSNVSNTVCTEKSRLFIKTTEIDDTSAIIAALNNDQQEDEDHHHDDDDAIEEEGEEEAEEELEWYDVSGRIRNMAQESIKHVTDKFPKRSMSGKRIVRNTSSVDSLPSIFHNMKTDFALALFVYFTVLILLTIGMDLYEAFTGKLVQDE